MYQVTTGLASGSGAGGRNERGRESQRVGLAQVRMVSLSRSDAR